MEENSFEGEWRKAIDSAEVQPSDAVWSSVESGLIAAENQQMKRQVILYQRLAAALILFALLFGAFGFYFGRNDGYERSAGNGLRPQGSPEQEKITGEFPIASNSAHRNPNTPPASIESQDSSVAGKHIAAPSGESPATRQVTTSTSRMTEEHSEVALQQKVTPADSLNNKQIQVVADTNRAMMAIQVESPIKQKEKEASIVIPGLSYPIEEEPERDKPKSRQEQLWAAMGFSTGTYNPGTVSNSNYLGSSGSLASTLSHGNSQPAIGSSYSFGLLVGKKVGERWIVQAGASYLNNSSAYTSNISASAAGSPVVLDLYNLSAVGAAYSITSPYQISSTLEFVSIPVQAGYLVLNRKLGVQMNAGVSTDLFLRNSLVDQSGQSGTYTLGAGSDSPYRSVNWAGLVSTELTYRVGKRYRIAIVPGMRYLLNSPMKSGATSNAYVTDIGFRFRYNLK